MSMIKFEQQQSVPSGLLLDRGETHLFYDSLTTVPFSNSCSSSLDDSLPAQEEGSRSLKSCLRTTKKTRRGRKDKHNKNVIFNHENNISYEVPADQVEWTEEETRAVWYTLEELGQMHDENVRLGGALVWQAHKLDSFHCIITKLYKVCLRNSNNKYHEVEQFRRAYSCHDRLMGLERHVSMVDQGYARQRQMLLKEIKNFQKNATPRIRFSHILAPSSDRVLRARCKAITRPSRRLAECLGRAQEQEKNN